MDTIINCDALLSILTLPWSQIPPLLAYFFSFFLSPTVMEDSKSWAKPVVGVWLVSDLDHFQFVYRPRKTNPNSSCLWVNEKSNSSRLSARRVNVYVCETMPDAHAVRATAAAHPQVGTSRETREVKNSPNPTAAVTRSGSVRICYALRWLSHMKRFQTSPFYSCLSSGWEKFSPRRILTGPGGEGLSGPSTTSPRTRGVQDDSGGQRCVPSLMKETEFLWVITILEPQPRVRSARRSGKVYLRPVGRFLKNKKHFTSDFEQSKTFDS